MVAVEVKAVVMVSTSKSVNNTKGKSNGNSSCYGTTKCNSNPIITIITISSNLIDAYSDESCTNYSAKL